MVNLHLAYEILVLYKQVTNKLYLIVVLCVLPIDNLVVIKDDGEGQAFLKDDVGNDIRIEKVVEN